jgi:uracil phosphoribosyltransferase
LINQRELKTLEKTHMRTEVEHHYGPQVHILHNKFLDGLLARLCSPEVFQPEINHLAQILYNHLLITVMNQEFPSESYSSATRMTASHPDQKVHGERIKKDQRAIVVNLARAGTYPSHVCFDTLHYAIQNGSLRQDHIFAARTTNDKNQVSGTDLGATKIGGDKQDAIVLFPDPMGATGHTIITALNFYKARVEGKARKLLALHLIVTPEYLKNVLTAHPDAVIYALRLDRGLSSEAVLKTAPGLSWDQERGLNDKDYIVPGGGGFGEIMNNSFV